MSGIEGESAGQAEEPVPQDAEAEDEAYTAYVLRAVERGLADADAGRVRPVAEVRRLFGLPD